MPPRDQRVGRRREQDQVDLRDRHRHGDVTITLAAQGGETDREGRLEAGDVLAGDGVAPRRQPHALEEREGRLAAYVLRGDPAEPTRLSNPDGVVDVTRVLQVGQLCKGENGGG